MMTTNPNHTAWFLALPLLLLGWSPLVAQEAKKKSEPVMLPETDPASPRHSKLDPAKPEEILRTDVTGDGKPDILERWWAGKRTRWFDEKGTLNESAVLGDTVNGALQVDGNDDGFYDGPGDFNVKWADRDGDGIPDIELFSRNPAPDAKAIFSGASVYYVTIDPDNTGLLADIDWKDLSAHWTRWDTPGNWRTDYHGNATFLKEHAPIWAVENPEYSWENPFCFWDPDGDGCSEVSLRVADDREFTNREKTKLRYDGLIDEAWVSYDLDNTSGPARAASYDFTLYVSGPPGVSYHDDVHDYPAVKAPEWARPFYRNFDWRQQTRFRYIDRSNAIARIFGGQWGRAIFTYDEDKDCARWERVEIYYPGDPYILKRRSKDSPIYHPQSDSLGDRGEWDEDFSGKGKLYRAAWDGKIHLVGAERGAWTVDREAKFGGGIHPNGLSSDVTATKVEEVIQYRDADGDGYFDTVIYDYDGDGKPERTDDLNALGIETKGPILDVTKMDWEALRKENTEAVNRSWQQAQRLFRDAFAFGFVNDAAISLSKASSVQEKYMKAYRLKETLLREILASTPESAHPAILKAYYSNDDAAMKQLLQAGRTK